MHAVRRFRPSPALVIALFAVVLAAGGFAYAAIPSANGTIHACYNTFTGALRVIDAEDLGAVCVTREASLVWNQKGAAGPVGAKGAPGPAGPQGPPGSFKGLRRVKFDSPKSNAKSKKVTVNCAPGEVATGGGHQLIGNIAGRVVTRSYPVGGSPPTGWQVKGIATLAIGNWRLRAWAVCAKL